MMRLQGEWRVTLANMMHSMQRIQCGGGLVATSESSISNFTHAVGGLAAWQGHSTMSGARIRLHGSADFRTRSKRAWVK